MSESKAKEKNKCLCCKKKNGAVNGDHGKKKEEAQKMVGVFEVFRFSDWKDRLMMCVGSLFAVINGATLPSMIIIFGESIETFVDSGKLAYFLDETIADFMKSESLTTEEVMKDIRKLNNPTTCGQLLSFYSTKQTKYSCDDIPQNEGLFAIATQHAMYYCIVGAVVLVTTYVQVSMWMTAAERQGHRIRQSFLRNVLRQDIGWFDTHDAGELNTRLSDDIQKIQGGIGDKAGALLQWSSCSITGFVIGFVYGWKLALVIMSLSPLLVLAASLMSKVAESMTEKGLEAYAKAGSVAEEAFGAIRTVVAFGGQKKEADRYAANLSDAEAFGVKKGVTSGASMGVVNLVFLCCYALGFWYGGKLIREEPDDYDVSTMIIVFFSIIIGAFSLGAAGPNIELLATARGAAFTVYAIIDMKSPIDSSSDEGQRPSSIQGKLQFKDIKFSYPSRPDVKVLKGMSLEALPGQTVALVGSSGCGKSTTVALLQRFYDPLEGQILIDGNNIKDLNLTWLRKHIGLVSQDPILFATTIANNIRYGREDVSMAEIEEAAKSANAYDFIMNLPKKFETLVGQQGAQLSGGQKQRVAIARALVRNPKILLLDEATSALDTESESIVQDALDKARQGRTTLVIAHRLSTIQSADIIFGFDKGVVVEKGTHADLMENSGIYYQLVTNQTHDNAMEASSEATNTATHGVELKKSISIMASSVGRKLSSKSSSEEGNLPPAPFCRLMKMNAPEWHYILLGFFAAIVNGGSEPAFAVIFSKMFEVFSKPQEEQKKLILTYALIFVGIGCIKFIAYSMLGYYFGKSGEKLTTRIRVQSFRSIIRQDIGWFDDHKHSVGALTTRLSTDASLVQGMTGMRLGALIMALANMGTSLIIAFIYGYKLALVIVGFVPFIALGGILEVKLMKGQADQNKEALEEAGKVAVESIENIRTVASLSKENTFFNLYINQLHRPYRAALKRAHVFGSIFAFSQAIIYFAYAASFVYGAHLVEENEMISSDVFLVLFAIMFGAMGIGNASAFAPDTGKAASSAKKIIQLLDSEPTIDYTSNTGQVLLEEDCKAEVEFKSCGFRYPTRPTVKVLQALSFSASPGQTLALVGSSGCGKSTTVALIERFYDVDEGSVRIFGNDVKSLNLQWLRSQLGIVSQEPVLFDRSIAENIAYGDNSREVTMDEIIDAARSANIHSFISELPNGYETNVGAKGTQLSGGQKQRVAIARALVRNPKILLLDEATSALDTESEKVVQEALDKARQGRTSIVIAHRMSTIKNADKICVFSKGKVREEGTHSELMANQGFYSMLVKNSFKT